MNKSLQEQIETYLSHLGVLLGRGRQLRDALKRDPSNGSTVAATRAWQEDCGVTIHQLSGGSKAHWLSRSFSEAFLMRSAAGDAVTGATPEEIVQRVIGVLEQAVASLSQNDHSVIIASSGSASSGPAPRRFDFVHNAELRPIVEQAYNDSRRALDERDYDAAMRTSCGILEAIVTDALEHKGMSTLSGLDLPSDKISDWPFETRLAIAEKAGLIRGGCARLPASARTYRDHSEDGSNKEVSEGDAVKAGQVLRVVMRDLNPSR